MRRCRLTLFLSLLAAVGSSSPANGGPEPCPGYWDPEVAALVTSPGDMRDQGRSVDVLYVLVDYSGEPIPGYPAENFWFVTIPHSDYPELWTACPGCEGWYTVACLDEQTNQQGEMRIRVSVGPDCSPSMCCPVEIYLQLPCCDVEVPLQIYMNTFDMVPSGVVDLSDIAAFGTALAAFLADPGDLQPCADFVYSPYQASWGELDLSDIAAFGVSIGAACSPFEDPCP